jgi:hypothetical protein
VSIKATTSMGNLTLDTLHTQEFYQLFFLNTMYAASESHHSKRRQRDNNTTNA